MRFWTALCCIIFGIAIALYVTGHQDLALHITLGDILLFMLSREFKQPS